MKSESSMRRHIIALQEKVQRLKNENLELRRELGAIDGQSVEAADEIKRLRKALRRLIEAAENETMKIPYKDGKDEIQIAREALGE